MVAIVKILSKRGSVDLGPWKALGVIATGSLANIGGNLSPLGA